MLCGMKRIIILILTACLSGCGGAPTHPEPVHGGHDAPHVGHDAEPPVAEAAHAPGDASAHAASAIETPAVMDAASDSSAPQAAPEPPAESPWFEAQGHLGKHTLAWRPIGLAKVPRNDEFEMEVLVTLDGAPAEVQLDVTGWMPAHSHGLVQMPVVESLGDGRHRVSGMLLHMRGDWQVRFSIIADRSLETVTFDLKL